MNREETWTKWKEDQVNPGFQNVREKFFENIADHQEMLHQILFDAVRQIGEKKENISYLHFQLPRTGVQSGAYPVYLFAYDQLWFLDVRPEMEEIEFSFFFQALSERKRELEEGRKIYLGKITKYDVLEVLYEEASKCFEELAIVLREWCWDLEEEEWVGAYPFSGQYQLRWGGYQEDGEIIFAMDNRGKGMEELLHHIKEDQSFFYTVWKGSDLCHVKLTGREMLFMNMKGAKLDGMDFSDSNLFQSSFGRATLTGCCFDRAACICTKFRGATLTGCSFQGADLTRADFRDTKLEGTNFSGAVLEGACFMDKQVAFLHLSPEQLQEIVIEGGRPLERGIV